MFKRKSMTIDVPNPCSENWDDMRATTNGKFCTSCEREVIDFTQMNDQEIIKYFKNNKNFCGSFNPYQLNRNYYAETHKMRYRLRRFVAVFMAFISLKHLPASGLNNKLETVQQLTDQMNFDEPETKNADYYRISGKVTVKDSSLLNNIPIHIRIAYTDIDIQPDFNGNYEIVINKDLIKQYTIVSFFHPNLKHESRTIHISSFPQILNIELDRPPSGRIGGRPLPY